MFLDPWVLIPFSGIHRLKFVNATIGGTILWRAPVTPQSLQIIRITSYLILFLREEYTELIGRFFKKSWLKAQNFDYSFMVEAGLKYWTEKVCEGSESKRTSASNKVDSKPRSTDCERGNHIFDRTTTRYTVRHTTIHKPSTLPLYFVRCCHHSIFIDGANFSI